MFHPLAHFVRSRINLSPRWLVGLSLLAVLACVLVSWRAATFPRITPTRTPAYLPGSQPSQSAAQGVDILINAEAAYELRSADLQAIGFHAQPEQVALTWRGQPVPLEIIQDDAGFSLRFYGYPSDSRYSVENIYQLRAAATLMMTQATHPAAQGVASNVYMVTQRYEQNLIYAPQSVEIEGWFWQMIPAPSIHSFDLIVDDLAEGSTRLMIQLWSDTEATLSPDHHLQVSINDKLVLDATWDGVGAQILETEIPAGVLVAGVNQLEINAPGDTGVRAERSYLDWIEVEYPRLAVAEDDWVIIEGAGQPVQVSGFDAASGAAITIWQVNGITQTIRLETENGLVAGDLGQRYLVIGPQGFQTPRLRAAATEPDLRSLPPAHYLAFGPDDLLVAAQPLLDWRNAHNLAAAGIPLQAVYDQFGDGFPEPEALQRFLAYAAANWPEPPQYILLLGDFTYDPRGYTVSADANRLPTFFIHTHFGGETASDVPFGDLDGDGLPDLAVGRLPARTPAEVQTYVQKALTYEQEIDTAWRTRLLAVADGQEASFASDAQVFSDMFSSDSFEKVLFAPAAGIQDANDQTIAYFNEGYGLVSYFGHGSLAMWGKDRLFTIDDVATLSNADRLPVVINMNCLTGLFTHPKTASLAETFLWHTNGGAVAVLAPTSLTLPSDQALLSAALARELNTYPTQTLGESFLAAQRQMPISAAGANEVLLTFLLFGDPALQPWGNIANGP